MSRSLLLVALVALLFAAVVHTQAAKVPPGPIKHFIVLMMENRAFDHMLGWMMEQNPNIRGINGSESNPWDINQPNGRQIFVSKNARDETPSPDHSINGTSFQIFGTPNPGPNAQPNMKGFVASGRAFFGDSNAPSVMECWPPEHVPVITSLANNFAMFDEYHASVPGPTDVNRLYLHSATSHGAGHNNILEIIMGYPQKTLYELLDEAGYSWGAYFGEVPDPLLFQYTRQPQFWNRFNLMDRFFKDLSSGNLPTFTFLSPSYFGIADILANDQHPAHAVTAGEKLMKEVYENLRSSPLWESSAMLLTYDEHGGFFDHQPTPMQGVPNPDGLNSDRPPFDFQRLGIRVPTILISPWVDSALIHEPTQKPHPTSKFDHTSLIASLTRMWGLNGPLTKRDAWAGTWDDLFKLRSSPRTDCPLTLPPIYQPLHEDYLIRKASRPEHLQPLSDLHRDLIQLGNAVVGLPPNHNLDRIKNEEQGGLYLRKLILGWIENNRKISMGEN